MLDITFNGTGLYELFLEKVKRAACFFFSEKGSLHKKHTI